MTVGFLSFGSASNFPNSLTNPNYAQIMIIPPLKGPGGVAWAPYTDYIPSQSGFIASKSKYQEQAFKLLDTYNRQR
jgi:hypothetical protein